VKNLTFDVWFYSIVKFISDLHLCDTRSLAVTIEEKIIIHLSDGLGLLFDEVKIFFNSLQLSR